jgi:GABA(A) receptor-associated protein
MTVQIKSNQFKINYELEYRKSVSQKLLDKYPDRIPIIVTSTDKSIVIRKQKFLVPPEFTLQQMSAEIRKQIEGIKPSHAIFIMLEGGKLPPISASMTLIYQQNKDDDGFLYLYCFPENTFG